MRARFDVLKRRDQELKDRDIKLSTVLAEQIKDFEQYRDDRLRQAWFEGYYAYENFIAKVKDYAAGDIDDPPTEPKNPYQLDQRKEQDHGPGQG